MKMKSNEALGVLLMILALLLALAAWTISASLGITALALFSIGAHLFYTERKQRRGRSQFRQASTATSVQQDPSA